MKEEVLKNVTDHYKNRIFTTSSEIGQGKLPHPVKVIASYDYLCLCEVTRAYITGQFKEFGIYKIEFFGSEMEEVLSPVPGVNFNKIENEPSRSVGTEVEAREMYDTLVGKMKLKFFQNEVRVSEKLRDDKVMEQIEQQVRANRVFIKSKAEEISSQLREMVHQKNAEALFSDKKIRALVMDLQILETLKKY